MYQFLLCERYLRTRYIALASIISVMLGVATMIVVNSVMSGFTTEMQHRIHGILSDLSVESLSLRGFPSAEWHMDRIRQVAGEQIAGMTPTVRIPAVLSFEIGTEWITRPVLLIGIDSETHSQVSDFAKYLQHPANRSGPLSFQLREGGYDTRDHQAGPNAPPRDQMSIAGWEYRRRLADERKWQHRLSGSGDRGIVKPHASLGSQTEASPPAAVEDPFAAIRAEEQEQFDMARQQRTGAILGIALACDRRRNDKGECVDRFFLLPGDDVILTFPNAADPGSGGRPAGVHDTFTIVDFYESKMSEYDAGFVFVPIEHLQLARGMYDRATGVRYVNSIQIKLRPGVDPAAVRDKLQEAFSPHLYVISTWQDKQGALLAAVRMETAILNVLLFLIIAVAGFGILAIFLMIVVEKTRDIGILKALGASSWGIHTIFIGYGLSLGLVGSGVGLVLGLLLVRYINPIADWLGWLTGRPLFDPEIYYFYEIPTIVDPGTVAGVVGGAILIAVMASLLPAVRAARLHPVEALRYE